MSTINTRFIVKMLGLMCILETFFMLIAAAVAFYYNDGDFGAFLTSSCIMMGVGLILVLIGRKADEFNAGRREGMLTVTLTWTLLSFLGMLPFYLGGYIGTITDAFFETMSGFTTTGASILRNVESMPHGILFWRSLLQWQGGIGMIVFTLALLPIFGGGALQMFDAETTGIVHEKFRPRVTQIAKRLSLIYVALTAVLFALLWAGPMDFFDALNHALTTLSTGGYSTKNNSIAYWHSSYVEYILSIFMCLGATNITLFYFAFKGNPRKLFKDEEARWFYSIVVIAVVITTGWLLYQGLETSPELAFRESLFQVTTLISSTGFISADYILWGPFFWMVALLIMIICGCTGSTSGGLKTGRFMILGKNLYNEFKRQTHPKAIIPVRVNGRIVSQEIVQRILAFVFIYIILVVVGCLLLSLDGIGFIESVGASVSAVSNVGPALGELGPTVNYADVPTLSKWILSFLMMVGRLEIFTVLTILLPNFWKQ